MFLFIKKVIVFLLPLTLVFLFPLVVLYLGREYVSVKDVIATQRVFPETLFGFAYNRYSYISYKHALMTTKHPQVIALGSSLVLEIRKEFFVQEDMFVNAGGAAGQSLLDIKTFIEDLPEDDTTKLIILGLDHDLFYKPSAPLKGRGELSLIPRIVDSLSFMSRNMYLDYFAKKYTITDLFAESKMSRNIGLSAILRKDGFRIDGSYAYNQAAHDTDRVQHLNQKTNLKAEEIKQDNSISAKQQEALVIERLGQLNAILELCRKRGIDVVAFTPPFPVPIYRAMYEATGVSSDVVNVLPHRIENVFLQNNMIFFDLSSIETFDGHETEFVDGLHTTDVASARILVYLAEESKDIRPYVNVKFLKKILKETHRDFFLW